MTDYRPGRQHCHAEHRLSAFAADVPFISLPESSWWLPDCHLRLPGCRPSAVAPVTADLVQRSWLPSFKYSDQTTGGLSGSLSSFGAYVGTAAFCCSQRTRLHHSCCEAHLDMHTLWKVVAAIATLTMVNHYSINTESDTTTLHSRRMPADRFFFRGTYISIHDLLR